MKQSASGVILFTTLMLISLIALMVLAVLKSLNLFTQVNQTILENHQALYRLEAAAEGLIMTLSNSPACRSGCSSYFEQKIYYYTLHEAGEYPCLVIREGEHMYASHHWLVEMHAESAPQQRLSLHVATLGRLSRCKRTAREQLPKGILTWRYEG